MEQFQYKAKQYVPRVDLNTLGKTIDTLEKGHKEAVKTASNLETAIANLDMNSVEDGFKQELVNNIKTTIDENTIYGNSYGALDDLIEQSGKLMSDPRVTGRLKAQQAYKSYISEIDKNKDLTETDKAYFLYNNPYHYEDIVNDKGEVVSGTNWTPRVSPTKLVDVQDLLVKAIGIAAKESGGGTTTRWIDANGKPTTDRSQAWGGEVYDEVTSKWTRLSKTKIRQALDAMIDGTHGAKESIQQQYDIAIWEHMMKQAHSKDVLIDDTTDENGNLLSTQQWLENKLNPGIEAASFYNTTTTTRQGSGYAKWSKAMALTKEDASSSMMNANAGPIELGIANRMAFNSYQEAIDLRNKMNKELNDISNKLGIDVRPSITNKNISLNNWIDVSIIDDFCKKHNVDKANYANIYNMINEYNKTVDILANTTSNLSADEKADYYNSMAGGDITKMKPNGNVGDIKKIINEIKSDNPHNEYLYIYDSNINNIKNKLEAAGLKVYNAHTKNGKKGISISIKDYEKNIDKYNDILNTYRQSFLERLIGSFAPSINIINKIKETKSLTIVDGKGNDITKKINKIKNKMNKMNTNATKSADKLFEEHKTSTIGTLSTYEAVKWDDVNLRHQLEAGLITQSEYNSLIKRNKDFFRSNLDTRSYSQNKMWLMDKDGVYREVKDSGEKNKIGNVIKSRVNKNDSHVTYQAASVGNQFGYLVITKDKDGEVIQSVFLPAEKEESTAMALSQHPTYVSEMNAYGVTNGTKGALSYNDGFAIPRNKAWNIHSIPNSDLATLKFGPYTVTGDTKTVAKYDQAMTRYKNIKNSIIQNKALTQEASNELAIVINDLFSIFTPDDISDITRELLDGDEDYNKIKK